MLLLALALLNCHGSRPGAHVATVRIAIHREPIAFLPVRVAQTLGYFEAEGLAVELSEVAGGTKAIEALLGGSVDVAAASMSDVVQLAAEGRDVRGFLVLLHASVHRAGGRAGPERHYSDDPGSERPYGRRLHPGLVDAPVSQLPPGHKWPLAGGCQHCVGRHVGQLCGRARAWHGRRSGPPCQCRDRIRGTAPEQHRSSSILRTLAGARQVFGSETFPSLSLLAEDRWLRANADTAQRLARAVKKGMRWVRDRPAEQVRQMIPDAARMSEKADLQAIQRMQQSISTDGLMSAASAELVEKFVAVSNPKVRAAHIDTARIYTNEFASAR